MSESTASPRRIEAAEKRREALQLRKAGLSFSEIARQLGYSNKGAACNAVHAELRALPRESAAEVLTLELFRLDALHQALWPAAMNGDVGATRQVLAIMERRAKYLRLDALDQSLDEGISLIGDLMKGIKAMAGPDEDDLADDTSPDDLPPEG